MAPGHKDCTSVSDECPVRDSIYGEVISLPASIFFCTFFAVILIIQLVQGLRWKSWTFTLAMTLGCLTECLGYIGRIMLHSNAYSDAGFEMQICCLILAPAFFSAGIYLTLKHLVLTFGSEHSRIPARYYTYLFIGFDLISLILQGSGGGTAASAHDDQKKVDAGTNVMLAGIVWQVFTLLIFAGMTFEFFRRVRQSNHKHRIDVAAVGLKRPVLFKLFAVALVTAFTAIFIRCVFRIAEQSKWRGPIMQNQWKFVGLDSCMCAIAVLALTIFHPGYCFPPMQKHFREAETKEVFTDDVER